MTDSTSRLVLAIETAGVDVDALGAKLKALADTKSAKVIDSQETGKVKELQAQIHVLSAEIATFTEKARQSGAATETMMQRSSRAIAGVDKTIKTLSMTSAEATRMLSNLSTRQIVGQFEAVSKQAHGMSNAVKTALAQLSADRSPATVAAAYRQLENTFNAIEQSYVRMDARRAQVISGLTAENTGIRALNASYRQLEATQKRTAALSVVKGFEQQLASDSAKFKSYVTSLTADRSASMNAYYRNLTGQTGIGGTTLNQMEQAAGEATKLAPAVGAAATATNRFTAAQWEAHAAARGLAGSLGSLWMTYGSLVPLLTGAAVGSALRELVSVGTQVQQHLKMIEVVGEGAKVSMNELSEATKGSVFSFVQATDALRIMVQAGMSSSDALSTLPAVLKLSTIGEVELGKAAQTTAAMLVTFGLHASEAARVTNAMARAAADSPTSVSSMMEAMRQASSLSSQYNVTIEETSAALAILAKRGIEGSAAGTSFRNLVKELAAPATKRAAESIEAMGISMYDANGNIKPLTENLRQLADVARLMSEEERIKWFESFTNERAAKSLDALVMDFEAFEEVTRRVTEAQKGLGFVTEANANLLTTSASQWKQFGADLQRVYGTIYEDLEPAMLSLIVSMREVVNSEGFKSAISGLASTVAGLTRFVMENGKALTWLFGIMAGRSVVTMLAGAMKSLGAATAAVSFANVGAAWTSAGAAFAATAAGASKLGLAIGTLGTILTGPLGLVAAGVFTAGIYGLYKAFSGNTSTVQTSTEAFEHNSTKLSVLAEAYKRGAEEVNASVESYRAQIDVLTGATSAIEANTTALKSNAIAQAEAHVAAAKGGLASVEGEISRLAADRRGDNWRELQELNRARRTLETIIADGEKQIASLRESYGNATSDSEELQRLKRVHDALSSVATVQERILGIRKEAADKQGLLDSGEPLTKGAIETTRRFVEGAQALANYREVSKETLQAARAEAEKGNYLPLEKLKVEAKEWESVLGTIQLAPKTKGTPSFDQLDETKSKISEFQQQIRNVNTDYASSISELRRANREGELSAVEMYDAMKQSAWDAFDAQTTVATQALKISGLSQTQTQGILNSISTAANTLETEMNRIDTARVKDAQGALLEVEKAEVESGKRRLSAVESYNLQWVSTNRKAITDLVASVSEPSDALVKASNKLFKARSTEEVQTAFKELAPVIDTLRGSTDKYAQALVRLFDAGDAGEWAVRMKQSLNLVKSEFDTYTKELAVLGSKSSEGGIFSLFNGNTAAFTAKNAQRAKAAREALNQINAEIARAPSVEIAAELRVQRDAWASELESAEQEVDPVLQGWGDSFGDYIANGIVYGFDKGESPAKAFTNMLKAELVKAIAAALSRQFTLSLGAMFFGGAASGTASAASGMASAASSGGSLLTTASNMQSMYNLYNNGVSMYHAGSQWMSNVAAGVPMQYAGAVGTGANLGYANLFQNGSTGSLGSAGATSTWGTAGAAIGGGLAAYGFGQRYGVAGGVAGGAATMAAGGAIAGAASGAGAMAGMGAAMSNPYGWIAIAVLAILGALSRSGERFKTTYGSASGEFSGGEYTSGGKTVTFGRQFGEGVDSALDATLALYTSSIGALHSAYGLDDSVAAQAQVRLRRTSGRLASGLYFDPDGIEGDAGVSLVHSQQYGKDGDVATALDGFIADIMTKGLAGAIRVSRLPENVRSIFAESLSDEQITTAFSTLIDASAIRSKLDQMPSIFAGLDSILGEVMDSASFDELQATAEVLGILRTSMESVYTTFTTSQDRVRDNMIDLRRTFDEAGLTFPTTVKAFTDLLESMDLTTKAGRALYVGLAELAPQILELQSAILDLAGTSKGALEDIILTGLVGDSTVEEISTQLNSAVLTGIKRAMSADVASQIADLMIGQIINPAITAIVAGGNIAEALNASDLNSAVKQIELRVQALAQVMNSTEVQGAFGRLQLAIASIGEAVGSVDPSVALRAAAEQAEQAAKIAQETLRAAAEEAAQASKVAQENLKAAEDNLRRAYEEQAKGYEQTIAKLTRFSSALRKLRDELVTGDASPLDMTTRRQTLSQRFEETAARANEGDEEAMNELNSLTYDYLNVVKESSSSAEEYYRQFAKVKNTLDATQIVTDAQLAIENAQLQMLTAQVSALININNTVGSGLGGVNNSVLSVKHAIDQLIAAQAAAQAAAAQAAQAAAAQAAATVAAQQAQQQAAQEAAQQAAKRADAESKAAWGLADLGAYAPTNYVDRVMEHGVYFAQSDTAGMKAAKAVFFSATGGISTALYNLYLKNYGMETGVLTPAETLAPTLSYASLSAIRAKLGWSGSIEGLRAKWGFATGGAFTNGIVSRPTNFNIGLMGEAGSEAIMPLTNVGGSLGVRAIMPGTEELIAEIRALRAEVEMLRAPTEAAARDTFITRRQLERWDGDGLPPERDGELIPA